MPDDLANSVDGVARDSNFAGVVRVDADDTLVFARAYGSANRAHGVANTVDTRFGIASGTKALTALVVVGLIEAGRLNLGTRVRALLGTDLPLIADDVTVELLLGHRSGIGDYVDEDVASDVTDYALPVPVHELTTTEAYLRVLGSHPAKFAAGTQFSYCNGGYVVLALVAERVAGVSFYDLVADRVCGPAGMPDTAFLRSDELGARVASGYLADDGLRTNVLHLPVRGSGDGGAYSTAADLHAFWTALFAGRIVSTEWVAEMVRPRSTVPEESMRYGLGFWLHESRAAVALEGSDAGVSFRSVHDPEARVTYTVLSNTSRGAWPVVRHLEAHFGF